MGAAGAKVVEDGMIGIECVGKGCEVVDDHGKFSGAATAGADIGPEVSLPIYGGSKLSPVP